DTTTWNCHFNKSGFRLPTEAEWECAARGGLQNPYRNFPCGDEPDATKANWPESKNPFRAGPMPWTTPVGFFNGQLHRKSDFGWPGAQETFQTGNGANGYGLYDMTGNVWQFINDWYGRDYYAYSPTDNPPGPASGSMMPDGKPYRGMRGGNWYNGLNGHGRVSNRNPSYFRGPQDPNHPYYHIGFRVVLPVDAESRPAVKLTPVQQIRGPDGGLGGGPGGGGRRPRPEGGPRQGGGGPGGDRPPRSDAQTPVRSTLSESFRKPNGTFILRSPEVTDGGALPAEFTGDGAAATLPLEWSGTPAGTKSYALIMHHEAPDQAKWYWILYNIPAETRGLPKNAKGVGTLGSNSVNRRTEYAPPHSKGQGAKTYIYTLYALSAPPQITVAPAEVNRNMLLAAMKDKILATAELSVAYTRPDGATERAERRGPASDRPGNRLSADQ
ncbi:MAG: SUMF1/EgtB/PvdO family nonheme iron enzyme, partial [Verrucomicrobiae bacterium]|nr:SUMF1/EgtB/PvdO family nonheme iron enzyme [Verrucomicrobiae bacterium]